MYLWKYWRDTRIVFASALIGVALLLLLVTQAHSEVVINGRPFALDQLGTLLPLVLFIQAVPVGFVAWLLGSYGAGRELGEKSGSFLFSRPRSRAFFIWSDWGFGMVQLLTIVTALNLVIGLMFHRLMRAAGDPFHGSLVYAGQPVSLAAVVCANIAAALLLAALVFSLTYFATIVLKSSRGVMLAIGILLGYILLGAIVKHYSSVELPAISPPEFASMGAGGQVFVDHIGLLFTIRAAVILLFPFAAHFVLQKADL